MDTVLISSLWVPIVVSTVIVFIASFVAWMVLPHHRSDWSKLPDEDGVRAALRGVDPGQYSMPHAATSDEWKSQEWIDKAKEGPNAFLIVTPSGPPRMGKSLALWFVYCLVISIFVAYLTGRTMAPGSHYLGVFRVAGVTAFLAYSAAHVSGAIWFGHKWSRTIKDVIDGLVYGLLTAGVFGSLWP